MLITDDELAVLDDLYNIRNDIVHGRPVDEPVVPLLGWPHVAARLTI